jgi:Sulfotransferase domain
MATDDGPVLLHIGYHKTGSKWLQKSFFQKRANGYAWLGHQRTPIVWDIVRTPALEFDPVPLRRAFEPMLEDAREQGLLPVVSFERFAGHPFSGGYDSKEIAHRLHELFGNARVLIVIREQSDVIVSAYKYYVLRGGASSVEGFVEPPAQDWARVPLFDLRYYEYHHLIRHYQRLFGTERVRTLAYEQFTADAASFVRQIADFTGRPLPEDAFARLDFDVRRNASPSAVAISVSRRLNRLVHRSDLNPAPLFESALADRLAKRANPRKLERFVPEGLGRSADRRMKAHVKDLLGDRYAASNRVTQELTGIDLAAWGWPVADALPTTRSEGRRAPRAAARP